MHSPDDRSSTPAGGVACPRAENARVRRRPRKPPPPTPVVVSHTGRAVVYRAILGAVLLGSSSAVADWQTLGAVDPADVLLGAALGLLAGPLALGERAARLGRPVAALVWCAGLAVVGVLVGAVQAGFAARVLATGSAAGAQAAAYADGWLAALDPSTLRVVVARALPLALVPALAGSWRRGGLLAGVVLGGLALPWLVMALAPPAPPTTVLLPGHGAVWGLPTGARASLAAPQDRATWLPGVALVGSAAETAWLRPVVLRAAALDALGLALAALLGDQLARRGLARRGRQAPRDAARRRRWLPLPRALPALAVAAVAALVLLRDRPPPPFLVGTLVDQVDEPLRRDLVERLLARLGPDDADAVPALAAKLRDPQASRRERAARLLARIGPPAAAGALNELGRALADLDPEVQSAVLSAIEALGPRARPLAGDVYHLLLATSGAAGRPRSLRVGENEGRLRALVDAWGYAPSDEDLVALLAETHEDVLAGALGVLLRRGALRHEHAPLLYAVARRGLAVERVLDALAGLGPGAALLRERLGASDLGPDDPLLGLLERELSAADDDVFALAARHARPEVRERAAFGLQVRRARGTPAGAFELLVSLLGDPVARVREAARRALRSYEEVAAQALRREVEARGPEAVAAAEVLGELGVYGDRAAPALAAALAGGDQALRLASARALGRIGGGLQAGADRDAALGALIAAVQDPDEQVAGRALEALRAFVGGEADAAVRAALVAALDAPSAAIRARAAMSLVHGGGATRTRGAPGARSLDEDLPALLAALVGGLDLPGLRTEALEALAALGPRARQALPSVRALVVPGGELGDVLRTIFALGLDAPGALEAVAQALRVGRTDDRLLALGLLRGQGPRAADVLDALTAALLDASPLVRRAAALALAAVDLPSLARARAALDARAAHEDDPQTAAVLTDLLRRLDEDR